MALRRGAAGAAGAAAAVLRAAGRRATAPPAAAPPAARLLAAMAQAAAPGSSWSFHDAIGGIRDRISSTIFGKKGEAELTVSSFLEMIRQQKGQHEARLGDTEREQLEFSQAAGDKVFSALSKEERKALESLPADADAYESLHPAIIKRLRREVPEGGVSAAMVRFQLEHYQYFKAAMAAAQEWRDAGNKEAPTADYIGRRVGAPPVPPAPKDPSKLLCTCGSGRLARNCCRPLYVI